MTRETSQDNAKPTKRLLQQIYRSQVEETEGLNQALQAERQLYVNLNTVPSGRPEAFEEELAAVQALRRQLEEGVERNNHLRELLEKQMNEAAKKKQSSHHLEDNPEQVSSLQEQVQALNNQLEESKRWNVSLQSRLEQQQQRGGGVGRARETVEIQGTENVVSTSNDSSDQSSSVSDSDNISDRELSVKQLREELAKMRLKVKEKRRHNKQLKYQLQQGMVEHRDIPGENVSDLDPVESTGVSSLPPGQQLEQLRAKLKQQGKENLVLRRCLDLDTELPVPNIPDLPKVKHMRNEMEKMKELLRQAEHQNDLLKKQIELDTSTDDIPSGFNPELIIQMSHEIERLKGELTVTREKLEAAVEGKPSGKPPSGPHKSQIPTLKTPPAGQSTGANAALRQKVESLRGQLHESKVLLRTLQDKLAATEATVRSQTDKMRYYRGLLEDAGLMPRTPQRSRSDSNLFSGRVQTPTKLRPMSASTDNLSMGTSAGRDMPPPSPSLSRGMSLTSLEEFGQTDNTDELKDQIKQQRKQLERYQRIIRSLQTRIRLGSDTAEKVYLGSPLPGSRRGSSDGISGGPPGLTPKTPGLDLVSQGNQAAFQRLQEQVEELKDKLRHSEDLNATLREQLSSSPSPEDIKNTVQKQQLEIISLKKQLSESYNMCENLRKRLEEVNGFLQELLHQDADGEVDVIDVTPTRVTDLKRKLCESINMATLLSTTLEAPFEEEEDEEEVNTTVPSTYTGTVPRSATAGSSNVGTGGTQTAGLSAVRGNSTQTDRMTMGSKSTQAGQQWTKMDGGDSRQLIESLEQENNKLKEQVQVVETRERELKAEVQRLQSELQKRGQQLEQLKLLLQKNQEQAQQTGQELHRLGCEVEEKNKKIAKLQKIIDQLQKRPTDSNIPTEEREIWGPEGLDQYDLDQMDRSSPSTHAFPATRQGNLDRRGQGDLDDLDARSSGGSRRSADRHDGQRSLRGQQGSDRGQDWSSFSSSSGTAHNRKDVKSKQYRKSRKVGGGGAREVGPSVSSDSGDEQLRGSVKYRPGDVGDSLDIERLRHRSASGSHREPRLTGRTVEGSTVVEESGLSSSSLHSSRVSSLRQPSGDRTAASADSFSNRGQHDLQDRTGRPGHPYGDSSYAHNIFGSREDVIVDLRDTGHDVDGDLAGLEFRVTNGQLDQELFGPGHRRLVDPDLPTDHLQSQSRIFEGEGRDNRERDRRTGSSRPSNSSSSHHSQRDGRSPSSSHRSGQRSSQGHRGQRAFEGHSYTSTAPHDSEKDKLIVNLQQKLKTVEELNETLKDEMKLFENIGTSIGIQSSPGMSTHSSQTRRDPHSTLQEHLNEIRELRKRLEESIRNNDLLREKLERRLEDIRREGGGGTTNVYLQQTETEVHELRQTVIEKEEWVRKLEKEMKELQNRCKALEKNNVELKQVNSDLDQANKQLEKTCQELQLVNTDLQKKNDQVNKQLTDSRQENKRMINDLNRAQQSVTYLEEQVQESQGLNKTLKMELNVFEKMREETREKGTCADFKLRDISGADMTDLFEEIRHLRVQLERSIEANNSLRQMLELSRDMGQQGTTSSVINIHHMHTRNTTNTKSTENREEILQRETSHPTGDQGNRYYSRDLYGEDAQRRTEEKIHPEVSHRTGDLGNRYHTYDLDFGGGGGGRDLDGDLPLGGGRDLGGDLAFPSYTFQTGDHGNRLYSRELDRDSDPSSHHSSRPGSHPSSHSGSHHSSHHNEINGHIGQSGQSKDDHHLGPRLYGREDALENLRDRDLSSREKARTADLSDQPWSGGEDDHIEDLITPSEGSWTGDRGRQVPLTMNGLGGPVRKEEEERMSRHTSDILGDQGNRYYSRSLDRLNEIGHGSSKPRESRGLRNQQRYSRSLNRLDRLKDTHGTGDPLRTSDLSDPPGQSWRNTDRRHRSAPYGHTTGYRDDRQMGRSHHYGTETNKIYHVYDPKGSPGTSPIRVDSDLRMLYAIGKIDDFELLRKEIHESQVVLSGMVARIRERLRTFRGASPSQSVEYSTLQALSASAENLRVCLGQEAHLITLFWISQLPETDADGFFVDVRLMKEVGLLREEVEVYKSKYFTASDTLRMYQERLEKSNRQKESMAASIAREVSRTKKVLTKSKQNFMSRYERSAAT
ncbi:uncharacterized protein LOC106172607 [Lingula anatina]|uniref:Uncharacterized protein LOC106172607 n=1 Tax=Lingula anatina TaxID=7574 RepID=A0A1S3JFF7_LINAN|nr:uncharacterized protein LOC106172607 [Lingula anatina]|eukprot:XP_013408886.1 uncharacterized protein LOC106172607 [Lingula anatina]